MNKIKSIESDQFNRSYLSIISSKKSEEDKQFQDDIYTIKYNNHDLIIRCPSIWSRGISTYKEKHRLLSKIDSIGNNKLVLEVLCQIRDKCRNLLKDQIIQLPIIGDYLQLSLEFEDNRKTIFYSEKTGNILSWSSLMDGFIQHTPIIEVKIIHLSYIIIGVYSTVINKRISPKL